LIRGLYSAASGMVFNFKQELTVMNNLANVSTTGYKKEKITSSDFSNLMIVPQTGGGMGSPLLAGAAIGTVGAGTEPSEIGLDQSQGDLVDTGNPLDLALSGPGFFAVQTPSGTFYTRDGTFFKDAMGRLATANGGLVLGENGPIQIGQGDVLVDGDGTVSVGGKVVGRIRLVDFDPQETMLKIGDNYLVPENPNAQARAAATAVINQGYLERSNVDPTSEMVDMLSALRAYEASQKMIQLQDQTLDRAVNEVSKV